MNNSCPKCSPQNYIFNCTTQPCRAMDPDTKPCQGAERPAPHLPRQQEAPPQPQQGHLAYPASTARARGIPAILKLTSLLLAFLFLDVPFVVRPAAPVRSDASPGRPGEHRKEATGSSTDLLRLRWRLRDAAPFTDRPMVGSAWDTLTVASIYQHTLRLDG